MNNEKKTAPKGDGPALGYSVSDMVAVVKFYPMDEPPTEAGEYLLIDRFGGINQLDYTVDGGWNTFFDVTAGEIYMESAMPNGTYGAIGWAPLIRMPEEVQR